MTTVNAREIVIPENLPELLDKRANRKEGEFRNLLADSGKLRESKTEAFRIALGYEIKSLMESDKLPKKPMSLERFGQMLWAVCIAYIMGTITITEEGSVQLGNLDDISLFFKLMQSDTFVFRNGREVKTKELIPKLQLMTSEDSIKDVYADVAGKGVFKKKELDPRHALNLAELIMRTTDRLQEGNYWNDVK